MDKQQKRNLLDTMPYKALEVDRSSDISYLLSASLGRPTYYRCRRAHFASSGVKQWRQRLKDLELTKLFRVIRLGRRVIFMRYHYNQPLPLNTLQNLRNKFNISADMYHNAYLGSDTRTDDARTISQLDTERWESDDTEYNTERWESDDD